MRKLFQFAGLVILAAVTLAALPASAQQRPRRLILKDGSYQSAIEWEVKGERVRYLSAERFAWEELPATLVDWEATERYERDRKAGKLPADVQKLSVEEEAERRAAEARSPVVGPGHRLPESGGVFLMDLYEGRLELLQLEQSGGELNRQMGKNILRATLNPFAGVKQSIELAGARAATQAHLTLPVIYVNLEESDSVEASATAAAEGVEEEPMPVKLLPQYRYRIVRMKRKKDKREVGNLKVAFTGRMSQQQQIVPARVEEISGGWYKVTPAAPLEKGEYALVEMLGEKEINLYVWDFGVDPEAPENAGAWKPAETRAIEDKPPELKERKKE